MSESHPTPAKSSEQGRGKPRRFSPEDRAEILRLYSQDHVGLAALAERFKAGKQAIKEAIAEVGGKLRTRSESLRMLRARLPGGGRPDQGSVVYRLRRAAGLCYQCGKHPPAYISSRPSGPGHKITDIGKTSPNCEECLERNRQRRAEHKRNRRCISCASPTDGRSYCDSCLVRQRTNYRRLKESVLAAYGGPRCACCGVADLVFLCLDHINDDGNRRRRAGEGVGAALYQRLKRLGYPPGFQVLCHNCNFAKANGGCPHKLNARTS